MAHPEWAVKYRRPGTELRCIHGTYCLYECTCVYDKTKKRGVKKTGRYLGSITKEGGFKESRKRLAERSLSFAIIRNLPTTTSPSLPTNKLLKSSIKSIADQEKNWTSASRIKNFIYLCNRELRFGLESIRKDINK